MFYVIVWQYVSCDYVTVHVWPICESSMWLNDAMFHVTDYVTFYDFVYTFYVIMWLYMSDVYVCVCVCVCVWERERERERERPLCVDIEDHPCYPPLIYVA